MKPRTVEELLAWIKSGDDLSDIEAWNALHGDEAPLDCEAEKVGAHLARRALAALGADRMRDCGRLVSRLLRTMASDPELTP